MKIRFKLILQYMIVTIVIMCSVFSFVYHITAKNLDLGYYNMLENKAISIAQKKFQKRELRKGTSQRILADENAFLFESTQHVLNVNDNKGLDAYLSKSQQESLVVIKQIKFKRNRKYSVAIYYEDSQGFFVVVVASQNREGDFLKEELFQTLIVLSMFCCALVFAFSWWNATLFKIPLQMMVTKTQEISANNLHLRLKERKGKDEIAELINLFNLMLERLEVSFNSQKAFISNASHELNNPLTAIMGESEVMQLKEYTSDEYHDSLKRIETESQRLSSLVKSLFQLSHTELNMSRAAQGGIDLTIEIKAIVDYLNASAKYNNRIRLVNQTVNTPFLITCNKDILAVALQNIIKNACKYSEEEVLVRIENTDMVYCVNVIDKGIGVPQKEIKQIFEPFYRAQNTYQFKGHGIGLSLADRIIKKTGGKIKVISEENKGTTVTIVWEKYSPFE